MLRTLTVLCLCLTIVPSVLGRLGYSRSCSRSSDCREGQCCRDRRGNLVGDMDFHELLVPDGASGVRGYCSRSPSQPGHQCSVTCGCTRGHTCYRTITGACCPPRTCWTDEAARKDKEFWDNCRPPNCFFPLVANQG